MNLARKISRTYGLQKFTDVINTSGSNDTGNDLSPEMKTFYNTQIIRMAEPQLRYKQFAKKTPMPSHNGKSVSWRKWTSFAKAMTALTEGVTPTGSKLNVSELTATVAQHGDYSVTSDVLQLTAIDNVIMEQTSLHASQAAVTLDALCRNEVMTGTNVVYAPKVSGTTVTAVTSRSGIDKTCLITPDLIASVAAKLEANNAPKIDGSYVAIIHPYIKKDIMGCDGFTELVKYTDNVEQVFKGEIGEIMGVRFVVSSEAKIWSVTTGTGESAVTNAVFGVIVFGENAYGDVDLEGGNLEVIVKQKGSAGTADPLNQRGSVGWKATCATKILIPEYLYRIECGTSFTGTIAAN